MNVLVWIIGWFGSCLMIGLYTDSILKLLIADIFISMMFWAGSPIRR